MIPILSFLLVLGISLLLTRIATVALIHTGMGRGRRGSSCFWWAERCF